MAAAAAQMLSVRAPTNASFGGLSLKRGDSQATGLTFKGRGNHAQRSGAATTSWGRLSSMPSTAATAAVATVVAAAGAAEEQPVERSYIMIKPDGVQRGLIGEIITRFERKGFVLKGLKLFQCPEDLAKEHYKDLSSKPFFPKLVEYIISGPVVAMAWEGAGVVASARKLIGATNPLSAEPGTIRGDFAVEVGRNVVHGSDSVENGAREIGLWFKEGELSDWEPVSLPWLRE